MSAIAFSGNVAVAPEVSVTPSGRALVRLVVAENQGHRDRNTGEWVEDQPTFWPVTLWGQSAENVAESIHLGDRVVVLGRTRTNAWETPEGEKRSRVEVVADDVAASIRFARVRIAKVLRTEPADSPAGQPVAAASGASLPDEPPF